MEAVILNIRYSEAPSRVRPSVALRGIRAARLLATVSAISVVALHAGMAPAQETAETGMDARWSAHGTVTARAGTERHIGELDLFLPLWQNETSLLFGDLRAQTDDAGNQEGNAGLGFRRMGENWIFGGYGFFDYRLSDETGNTFMQGTFGVEALTESLDLRANVYLPESGEQAVDSATAVKLVGGSLQMRTGFERALPGGDGEIGYRLWVSQDGGREVRAFLGGYYFYAAEYETVSGGRGRVEARLFDLDFLGEGSRFTVGAEITQDNLRDTQGFATARLTIPLGGGRRSGQGGLQRRMTDYVVRDVDVITGTAATGPAEAVTYADTGVEVQTVTVVDANDDIVTTAAAGGIGDLIVVDGRAGDVNVVATIALTQGETLLGGGSGIAVIGVKSGQQLTYTAPGARPTITGDLAGDAVITLADDTNLFDLDIENTSTLADSHAVVGTSVTGALLSGNNIETSGENAIHLDGGSANTISGNAIIQGGTWYSSAVFLLNTSDNTVTGNDITANGTIGQGVVVSGGDSNMITGNDIVAGKNGVEMYNGTTLNTVSDNLIDAQDIGIAFLEADFNTVTGNEITTEFLYGVYLELAASNTIDNNTIVNNVTGDGFFLTGNLTVLNSGTGNSYTGPDTNCLVDPSVIGVNSIDLCP